MQDLEQYLKEIKFDKQLNKLLNKLKNKKIIIYGAGSFFELIQSRYDLSLLNIIGISDGRYKDSDEGENFLGYKIIPKNKLINYNPDVILISTLRYMNIIYDLKKSYFPDKKVYIRPLAEITWSKAIKNIWKY